jgi:hypothetical protein
MRIKQAKYRWLERLEDLGPRLAMDLSALSDKELSVLEEASASNATPEQKKRAKEAYAKVPRRWVWGSR